MMNHSRMHICLSTGTDCTDFVDFINQKTDPKIEWTLESGDGRYCVNARSLVGVLYFCTEHNRDTYLVNSTDGSANFPAFLERFRI